MSSPRATPWIVAALAACVLLPSLGTAPLWDEDEPLNAACSLAMYTAGDWVVPTYNGRLRIEKPALVNWIHLLGFRLAGCNETGARLGSALLTVGTCLLTWDIARRLYGSVAAGWAGAAMATCLWTGVAGRAATPDAPLAFCTTLALALFARGLGGPLLVAGRLPLPAAIGVGAACGLATLAKGPVGLVLPLAAFGLFGWWRSCRRAASPERTADRRGGRTAAARAWLRTSAASLRAGCHEIRFLTIACTALLVAAPWYVAVTLRTDGEWLRGFLLVHNVGRFAAPMEGHSGSTLLYYPFVLLLGGFPWSSAWIPIALHALHGLRVPHRRTTATASAPSGGSLLLAAWIVAWVVPFSLSGTKLPGYVWPAYPALACFTGRFIADWITAERRVTTERWMHLAWISLAAGGIALGIGLPLAARRIAPGTEWLGIVGLLPVAGAAAAWFCQRHGARRHAVMAWGATAAVTLIWLVGIAPAVAGRDAGVRHLLTALPLDPDTPVVLYRPSPSTVFYTGRMMSSGRVPEAGTPAALADLIAANPGAHVVLDARFEQTIRRVMPAGYAVIRSAATVPQARRVLLIGPPTSPPATAPPAAVAARVGP